MFTRPSRLAFGAGALAVSAMFGLFGALPNAAANEDPALNPPNCSAADLAGVRTGVDAATATYLFTHPDVNYFYTSLEGLTREQTTEQVATYLDEHPQIHAEMTGVRQPLMDLKNRCGNQPPAG